MKIIADSGSTKTDWKLVHNEGSILSFHTEGYNPYFTTTEKIIQSLNENLLPQLKADEVVSVFFYGAGCSHPEKNKLVETALHECFRNADVFVNHDLLAAARALLETEMGFAAILGTGTNTALYDGKKISLNIDSLGYLLGDEGSGCYIGKKIIAEHMRNQLPDELEKKFTDFCPMTFDELFDRIHFKPLPNRFCAGFGKFVVDNKSHALCRKIIEESISDFFKNIVSRYPDYRNYRFNCVGSIAFLNSEIIEKTCSDFDMKFGKIIRSPIDELVKFHLT